MKLATLRSSSTTRMRIALGVESHPEPRRRQAGARRADRADDIREMTSRRLLRQELFRRIDESPDALFYEVPRFVTHIDDAAIAAVTQLYREYFPAGGAILDLMSSWVSHLPAEVAYRRVVGLGMNAEELAANPRLHTRVVQDLNQDAAAAVRRRRSSTRAGSASRWTT